MVPGHTLFTGHSGGGQSHAQQRPGCCVDEAGCGVSSNGVPERGRLLKPAAHKRGRKRRSYIPDSGSSAFSAWQQGGEVFSLMSVEKGPEDEENKSGDSSYMQPSM